MYVHIAARSLDALVNGSFAWAGFGCAGWPDVGHGHWRTVRFVADLVFVDQLFPVLRSVERRASIERSIK